MTPEFSIKVPLNQIGSGETQHCLAATPEQCAALARRFGLVRIDKLEARASLAMRDGVPFAQGRIDGALTQSCVATGVDLDAHIVQEFAIRFVTGEAAAAEEVELDAADCDTMEHDSQAVDLGEAAAQTLALALDPFPRAADADAALKAAGVLSEGEAGPFAALKGLVK